MTFPGESGQQGQLFRDQPRAGIRRLHFRARHPPPGRRQLHGMKRKETPEAGAHSRTWVTTAAFSIFWV